MTRRGLDLIQGTLEFLILETFASGEPRHGFGVLTWIRQVTGGALEIEEGALYPALHRMERRGWLTSEWGVSGNNRKAKYYSLTSAGRTQLEREESTWRAYVRAVDGIITRASSS